MSKFNFSNCKILSIVIMVAGMLYGCASIGNPSGGARDEDPPRFVSANPAPGSVNVDSTDVNISILFNELINVKNAFEKVVLSPPGKSVPRVSTRGRRVIVSSTDTLLPNTTYTIDFGDAIEDNNEANVLSGFAYTFSTGPELDSLRISGMVLGAENMEPQQGVFVGAYTTSADSAFLKMPFERLARTDELGRFVIRGLRDTTYRLFALKDLDNDKHFANPEEDIAWFEDTIRPTSERILTHDTIRNLTTGVVDTVIDRERTRFLPNNVLLRMFNTGIKPQYLVSYNRPDSTKLDFIFNAPGEGRPKIRLADDEQYPDPLVAEASIGNDTLAFFLPRDIAMRDTLKLAIEYINVDVSTGTPRIINDTVKLMKPKVEKPKEKKKKSKKKKDKKEEKEASDQTLQESDKSDNPSAEGNQNPDEDRQMTDSVATKPELPTFKFKVSGPDRGLDLPISIEVPVPLAALDTAAIRLEVKEDTLWLPMPKPYRLERADTLSERRFKIEYPWEMGASYRLTIDSIAASDIYGTMSEKLQQEFKTKSEDELSNLKITLSGIDPNIPAFVQLLSSDNPKYTAKVTDGVAEFKGIDGGKYYMRMYEDFNGDGRYTTGAYRLQRVYGEITPPDSLAIDSVAVDSVAVDSVAVDSVAADSVAVDSVAIDSLAIDSVAVDTLSLTPKEIERPPLTDAEMVKRLVKMGYSLTPLETDTIGKDILIAIQPDLVYYYPKQLNVKKAWDVEQSWNVFETALDLQKPAKIKKNKPKRNNQQTEQPLDEEEEEDNLFDNPFNPNERKKLRR